MNETHTAVLSAFLDQEAVDLEALADALEDPAGRAALIDFARLRQGIQVSGPPLPPSLRTLRRRPVPQLAAVRWPAAAALLVLMFLAGWLAPRPFGPNAIETSVPEPVRVEKFIPGVDWSGP